MEKLSNVDRASCSPKSSWNSNLVVLLNTIINVNVLKPESGFLKPKCNLERKRDRITARFPLEFNLSRYNCDKVDDKIPFDELMYRREVLFQLDTVSKTAVALCGDYIDMTAAGRDLLISKQLDPVGYDRAVQLTLDVMSFIWASACLSDSQSHMQRVLGLSADMSYAEITSRVRVAASMPPLRLLGITYEELPPMKRNRTVQETLESIERSFDVLRGRQRSTPYQRGSLITSDMRRVRDDQGFVRVPGVVERALEHVDRSAVGRVEEYLRVEPLRLQGLRVSSETTRRNLEVTDEITETIRRFNERGGPAPGQVTTVVDGVLVYGPTALPIITSKRALRIVLSANGRSNSYIRHVFRSGRLQASDDPLIRADIMRTQVKLERVGAVVGEAWDGLGGTVRLSAIPYRILRANPH